MSQRAKIIGEIEAKRAHIYFINAMKKCHIDRGGDIGIQSFNDYLKEHYIDNCYYYSLYALMGLKNTDRIVRGALFGRYMQQGHRDGYGHGWVVFEHGGNEWVFDNKLGSPVLAQIYYNTYCPKITAEFTKQKVLSEYLSGERSEILDSGTFKVKNKTLPHDNEARIDLRGAEFLVQDNKVKKFIARDTRRKLQ